MKHAREDYNRRIQDAALQNTQLMEPGSTPIGEDEPVFLIRAQDKNMGAILRVYTAMVETDAKHDPAVVNLLNQHYWAVKRWQDQHGCKAPDVPNTLVKRPTPAEIAEEMKEE